MSDKLKILHIFDADLLYHRHANCTSSKFLLAILTIYSFSWILRWLCLFLFNRFEWWIDSVNSNLVWLLKLAFVELSFCLHLSLWLFLYQFVSRGVVCSLQVQRLPIVFQDFLYRKFFICSDRDVKFTFKNLSNFWIW